MCGLGEATRLGDLEGCLQEGEVPSETGAAAERPRHAPERTAELLPGEADPPSQPATSALLLTQAAGQACPDPSGAITTVPGGALGTVPLSHWLGAQGGGSPGSLLTTPKTLLAGTQLACELGGP